MKIVRLRLYSNFYVTGVTHSVATIQTKSAIKQSCDNSTLMWRDLAKT